MRRRIRDLAARIAGDDGAELVDELTAMLGRRWASSMDAQRREGLTADLDLVYRLRRLANDAVERYDREEIGDGNE